MVIKSSIFTFVFPLIDLAFKPVLLVNSVHHLQLLFCFIFISSNWYVINDEIYSICIDYKD